MRPVQSPGVPSLQTVNLRDAEKQERENPPCCSGGMWRGARLWKMGGGHVFCTAARLLTVSLLSNVEPPSSICGFMPLALVPRHLHDFISYNQCEGNIVEFDSQSEATEPTSLHLIPVISPPLIFHCEHLNLRFSFTSNKLFKSFRHFCSFSAECHYHISTLTGL